MNAGASNAVAQYERSVLALRNCNFVRAVADGDSLFRARLPQVAMYGVSRSACSRGRVAGGTSFQCDDGKPGVRQVFAMMAPVQPKPIIKASARFLLSAMSSNVARHIWAESSRKHLG